MNDGMIDGLIEGLRSQDPARINECSKDLQDLMNNEEFFFEMEDLAKRTEDCIIKNYCYILMRKMLNDVSFDTYNNQYRERMECFLQFLFEELSTERTIDNVEALCEILKLIAPYVLIKNPWPEMVELSVSMLKSDNIAIGLIIINAIFPSLNVEDQNSIFPQLCEHFVIAIQSSDETTRKHSYIFIETISINLDDPEMFDSYPDVYQHLFFSLVSSKEQKRTIAECSHLCSVVSTLLNPHFASFSENVSDIMSFCESCINNTSISLQKRILLTNIIESGLDFLDLMDDYDTYSLLEKIIYLTIESIDEETDNKDYLFSVSLFIKIAESLEDFYSIFSMIVGSLIETETQSALITSLVFTSSVLPVICDNQLFDEKIVLDLMEIGFRSTNDIVLSESSDLFINMNEYTPRIVTSHIDFILEICTPHLLNWEIVRNIDNVLVRATGGDSHRIIEFIKVLVSLINEVNEENKPTYIDCLSSALLWVKPNNEFVLSYSFSIIDICIENSYISSLSNMYSSLCYIMPLEMKPYVNDIVSRICSYFSSDDPVIIRDLCKSLIRIVLKHCNSIKYNLKELYGIIMGIYQTELLNTKTGVQFDAYMYIIWLMGVLISTSGNILEEFLSEFETILQNFFKSDSSNVLNGAYHAYNMCIVSQIFDPMKFVPLFINQVFTNQDVDIIVLFFMAIKDTLLNTDKGRIIDCISELNNLFEIFVNDRPVDMCDDKGFSRSISMDKSLFECLNVFLQVFPENSPEIGGKISDKLIYNCKSFDYCINGSLFSLSLLATFLDSEEINTFLIETSFKLICTPKKSFIENGLLALIQIENMRIYEQVIPIIESYLTDSHLNSIVPCIISYISHNNKYSNNPTKYEEISKNCIGTNDYLDHLIIKSKISRSCNDLLFFCVHAMVESQFYWNDYDESEVGVIINTIQTSSNEKISQILRHSEWKIAILNQRLSYYITSL